MLINFNKILLIWLTSLM